MANKQPELPLVLVGWKDWCPCGACTFSVQVTEVKEN